MTDKVFVIHHRDSDGYCSALAPYCLGLQATYIDVQYGEKFPLIDLDEETVIYVLDFSFERDILDDVNSKVKKLVVIDHHKTAKVQLAGAPYALYDMTRCGAAMSWEYFHGYEPTSTLHQLVEDYDLWRHKYPESQWLENALLVNPKCKDLWYWKKLMENPLELQENINIGKGIGYGNDRLIERIVRKKDYHDFKYFGMRGIVMNTTVLRNEIASELLKARTDVDFVVTYRIMEDGRVRFAFRGRPADVASVDVSRLAKDLGGGGHESAASAVVSINYGLDLIKQWYNN